MKGIITWIIFGIAATITAGLYFALISDCYQSTTLDNVIIGVYASGLVVILIQLISKIRMYNNYHYLQGDWEECGLKGRQLQDVLGDGKIRYRKNNVLTIQLTHDQRTWRGQIIMSKDYQHRGHIVWHYDPLTDQEHEFGIKELLVPEERNKVDSQYDYLYLVGVNYAQAMAGKMAMLHAGPNLS